ncbi:hypothetical protein CEXT_224081 [Caerostris extrusa]|uniref:Uncharacterized protein n=1 Tax=Caerostris extrusa TaxID=172846 RepID=A0AAV4Y8B1_CAEEX|nr:hypothetical protein CEXT_224081 [Caerostris extrusa]
MEITELFVISIILLKKKTKTACNFECNTFENEKSTFRNRLKIHSSSPYDDVVGKFAQELDSKERSLMNDFSVWHSLLVFAHLLKEVDIVKEKRFSRSNIKTTKRILYHRLNKLALEN